MPAVLIADKLNPQAAQNLESRGIRAITKTGLAPEALCDRLRKDPVDGILVRSACQIDGKVLAAAAPSLKIIGRAGVGVDNIDINAASKVGVIVMNTPFGNSRAAAEQTIAMLFASARNLCAADASMRLGKWERSKFSGIEIAGKTLGVIGVGHIGGLVTTMAQSLSMRVIAFDPFLSDERARELGIEAVELNHVLETSDFISIHTPLNDRTRGLIGQAELARLKPSCYLINCARGGIIDEGALVEALDQECLAGAAVDVFEQEPPHADHPLLKSDRTVLTPHLGASTEEAQERVALEIAEQVASYLLHGTIANAINVPNLQGEAARHAQPYVKLAILLASLAAQLSRSAIHEVKLTFAGEATEIESSPVIQHALAQLVGYNREGVNFINARTIADEIDIRMSEERQKNCDPYRTLLRLHVTTKKSTRTYDGTLIGGSKPHLAAIDGIPIESSLAGNMLFLINRDEPGVIGRIGDALADGKINIATFHLGRKGAGAEAIALIGLDQPPSLEVVERVRTLSMIERADTLFFPTG